MTITQLAKLNKANGGHFFDRDTLKAAGDTMRSFRIWDDKEHPDSIAWVSRKNGVGAVWCFSKITGRVTVTETSGGQKFRTL